MRAGGLVSEAFMSTMKTSLSEENELCLMAWARKVEKRKGHSQKSTLRHPRAERRSLTNDHHRTLREREHFGGHTP